MTGWPVKKIQDICAAVNVGHVGTSSDVRDPNGISFLMGKNVGPGHLKLKSLERVKPSFHATQRKSQLQEGDIVVVRIGNSGQAAKIPVGFGEANCSGLVIIKSPQDVMADYLVYFLNSPRGRKYSVSNAKGSTRQTLNTRSIAETPVPVPPMEEQKRIVALLDEATARVTELTACYEQARTHANDLFSSALRDALEGNPDWPFKTLGEVAVVNPSEPALSEDAPFVPMDAVTAGRRDVQYTQPRGQRSGARARAGDILFARITPCLQNGKVALVQDEITRCGGSTEFIVVRAGSEVLNGYLYQWITSDHIRDEVTALMKGATGRQRLNAEDLAQTELPVPPLDEQKRIVARLDSMRTKTSEMVAAYDVKLTAAKNLRQSILEAAFAGEL
jgi:type I restriction enzyme S subunit